jgi:hypothetical protein
VPLVVGLVLVLARGLAMTLGFLGVAEYVGGLGRLALAARGSLLSRGGAVMRSALLRTLILLLASHVKQAIADQRRRTAGSTSASESLHVGDCARRRDG